MEECLGIREQYNRQNFGNKPPRQPGTTSNHGNENSKRNIQIVIWSLLYSGFLQFGSWLWVCVADLYTNNLSNHPEIKANWCNWYTSGANKKFTFRFCSTVVSSNYLLYLRGLITHETLHCNDNTLPVCLYQANILIAQLVQLL